MGRPATATSIQRLASGGQVKQTGPELEGQLQELVRQVAEAVQGPSRALQALQAGLRAAHYQPPLRVLAAVRRRYPTLHLTEDYLNQWDARLFVQGQQQAGGGDLSTRRDPVPRQLECA